MEKEKEIKKPKNIVRHLLEYKKAMRECVQNGGTSEDMQKVAKSYGLRLVKPF